MPRKFRLDDPGAIYHVMNWGDQRQDIFLDDDQSSKVYARPTPRASSPIALTK
jgi:hypothetical protein